MKVLVTIVTMVATTIVFAYSTFATKDEVKATVVERLDRIETKVDTLLER